MDFSYGERYASDAALYCKGVDLTNIDKAEEFEELCPEFLCLGEWSCHFEIAKVFFPAIYELISYKLIDQPSLLVM